MYKNIKSKLVLCDSEIVKCQSLLLYCCNKSMGNQKLSAQICGGRERGQGQGGWRENLVSLAPSKNKPFMYLPPHAQSITSLFISLPLSHVIYINTFIIPLSLTQQYSPAFLLTSFCIFKTYTSLSLFSENIPPNPNPNT